MNLKFPGSNKYIVAAIQVELKSDLAAYADAVEAHAGIAEDPNYTIDNCTKCGCEVYVGGRSRVVLEDPDIPAQLLCMPCVIKERSSEEMRDVLVNLTDLTKDEDEHSN